jgi:hypothetical protein
MPNVDQRKTESIKSMKQMIKSCNVSNKSPTRCYSFSSFLLGVYLQLNMFRASSRPSTGAQQQCYHHAPKVKPEAATAVVELLMMGVRTPETCWAVNKRQVKNWRNCCIWLVIYLKRCMMMHGLTNVKDKISISNFTAICKNLGPVSLDGTARTYKCL